MATHIAAPSSEPVSVGRIISRSFAVIGSNPLVMFGIAFLFGALPSLVVSYFGQNIRLELATQPNGVRDSMFIGVGSGLISLVLAMIVQGALVRATVAYTEGRRATFGESVAAGLRVALPLILLAIIVGICVSIGFALIIVPGVILYLIWSVAAPVLVEEHTGVFGALGRSRSLTKGARWKIFGLELIILVAYWIVGGVLAYALLAGGGGLQAMARMGQTGFPVSWLIGNAVAGTLINTFWSAAQTSLYVELRDWKDGPATQQLEEVFA